MRPFFFLWWLFLATFACPAFANDEGPVKTTRSIWQLIYDHRSELDVEQIKNSLNKDFDADFFAQKSLIKHWSSWSQAQKEEFKKEFMLMLARQLKPKLDKSDFGDRKAVFVLKSNGPQFSKVQAVTTYNKKPITILASLIKKNGQWLVYDVDVEDVNFIINYTSMFNKTIRLHGYNGLIEKLKRN